MKLKAALALSAGLLSVSTLADDWKGKGELGYVNVSGNTDQQTFNAAFEMSKEIDNWKHTAKAKAIASKSDEVKTAESYEAGWRTRYTFSEHMFTFGDFRYFDDQFDSFTEIYTIAFGIGYKVINRETLKWDISAGLGYKDTEIDLVPYEDISGATYLLESDYDHQLTETTLFENYTRVEFAEDNTFAQNVTGLAVSINSSLALKVGYELRYNTDPTPGFVSTDRILSASIVYSF